MAIIPRNPGGRLPYGNLRIRSPAPYFHSFSYTIRVVCTITVMRSDVTRVVTPRNRWRAGAWRLQVGVETPASLSCVRHELSFKLTVTRSMKFTCAKKSIRRTAHLLLFSAVLVISCARGTFFAVPTSISREKSYVRRMKQPHVHVQSSRVGCCARTRRMD